MDFTDVFDLRFGLDQWESVYDEIEVKIEPDDFPDNVPDPEDNMGYLCQTNEPTPGQNVNFLPDLETVGVYEWTADNTLIVMKRNSLYQERLLVSETDKKEGFRALFFFLMEIFVVSI